MDEPIIRLNCYEPAGTSLDFSREDLLGHTLAIGGSGSGKTTRLVYPMVEQLIRQRDVPASLCIIDTKADSSMQAIVETACREAGRENDFLVIDGARDAALNILNPDISLDMDRVDALAGLLASSIPSDSLNRFWEQTFEALLRQALRLHAFNPKAEPTYTGMVSHLMRYLLLHRIHDPHYLELIKHLSVTRCKHERSHQLIIDEVIATHQMWETLDHRTRTNLQSMAASVLAPMNHMVTHRYFAGNNAVDIGTAMNAGKVVLISIDALRHPECARLLGCIIKGHFYDSVLGETGSRHLKGLVLDDWPIAVTAGRSNRYSDVEALSMIRSRGGFLIAATQSLAALDVAIGRPAREAALANFANLAFFRSRDPEVDALAAAYLGQKKDKLVDVSQIDRPPLPNRIDYPIRIERELRVPAVPPGALARLATGDAYALIGPKVFNEPHCMVPTFIAQPQ